MPKYEWTTDRPTEPGPYWFRSTAETEWGWRFPEDTILHVLRHTPDTLWAVYEYPRVSATRPLDQLTGLFCPVATPDEVIQLAQFREDTRQLTAAKSVVELADCVQKMLNR